MLLNVTCGICGRRSSVAFTNWEGLSSTDKGTPTQPQSCILTIPLGLHSQIYFVVVRVRGRVKGNGEAPSLCVSFSLSFSGLASNWQNHGKFGRSRLLRVKFKSLPLWHFAGALIAWKWTGHGIPTRTSYSDWGWVQWSGRFLVGHKLIGWDPSVCKSNGLRVDILRLFFINMRSIP
jgi:hypothetical protein